MTSHLKEYLDYYNTLEAPGYAVLVTGAWGVGKTYQTLASIPENKHYYVSLFGLNNTEEVHAAVMAAMAPSLEKVRERLTELGGAIEKLGGAFALGGAVSGLLSNALRKELKPDRTLVLDDLERCSLDISGRLGVIQAYLEQYSFRVVVITHDENLIDTFHSLKEKTFGHTIKVEPQINEAFEVFASKISISESFDFIEQNRETIIKVFRQSGMSSLRVLRHLINDVARLHSCLAEDHLADLEAVTELVELFSALNIEVRAGNLKVGDLEDRAHASILYEMKRHAEKESELKKQPFLISAEKYPSANLESQILSDSVLAAMLVHGHYDVDEIRAAINNSPFFLEPNEAPPWRTVIQFDELDDGIVEAAALRMEQQFEHREVTCSGEMLHMFSLRLMMSQNGIIESSLEQVRDECFAYIDDLLESGRLPERDGHWQWTNAFARSHDGHGYWVTEQTEQYFKQIFNQLVEARETALERRFPDIASDLLRLIATDGDRFFAQVCHTRDGENPYASIPVLTAIEPKQFVGTWLESTPANWRAITYALAERYAAGRLHSELAREGEWVSKVRELLEDERDRAKGFRALRIERVIEFSKLRQLDLSDTGEGEGESNN